MESVEGGSEIVSQTRLHEFMILVRDEDEPLTPYVAHIASRQLVHHQRHSLVDLKLHQPPPTQPCVRPRMLYYVNCGILLSMYGPLIGLVQVKFQNNHDTPFETHYLFMIMSVVALSTSALSFRLLVYTTTIPPSIYYMVVTSVIFFLAILAPLSLVLVLFIPPRLIWIGYVVVCVLFLSVVTYNFIDYIVMFGNKISAITNVTKWFGGKG